MCASAGNHGQGVAYACRRLGIRGRVHVPSTTPRQKRERIIALGGDAVELVVGGDTYDEAAAAAAEHAARTGATVVPAFDDPRTIAGQGTVGAEIVAQLGRAPDVVVVPVGGGGLLAGVGSWLAARHPQVRIVGVEPAGAASMTAALAAGAPVALPELDTFVDGAAVRRVGDVSFPLVRDCGAELVDGGRGPGLHRDARPLPGRRDHRRARGRAGRRRARPARPRARRRRSCACSRAATTT